MADKGLVACRVVSGVFSNGKNAANAIGLLLNAGFERRKISVIGPQSDEFRKIIAAIIDSCTDQLLIYCAIIGAIIGAFCGWYAIAEMSGVKSLISSMPLLAALTGAAAGAYMGLFAGGLLSTEVPTTPSTVREQVNKKELLVSVTVIGNIARYNAESVLRDSGAEEVIVAYFIDEHSANTT